MFVFTHAACTYRLLFESYICSLVHVRYKSHKYTPSETGLCIPIIIQLSASRSRTPLDRNDDGLGGGEEPGRRMPRTNPRSNFHLLTPPCTQSISFERVRPLTNTFIYYSRDAQTIAGVLTFLPV